MHIIMLTMLILRISAYACDYVFSYYAYYATDYDAYDYAYYECSS